MLPKDDKEALQIFVNLIRNEADNLNRDSVVKEFLASIANIGESLIDAAEKYDAAKGK